MSAWFVYVTASDKTEALRIGRVLVENRLAACVNVIDNMTSLYWWQGQMETGDEVVLIAKTKTSLVDAVIERVRAEHSYDCACVVAWPIPEGNPAYLEWIQTEARHDAG